MIRKRSKAEIRSELDQHNRNVSWTCGRAGVEGYSLDPALTQSMIINGKSWVYA